MQTPHILIVEDEQVTRNTLKSIFEAEALKMQSAGFDGQIVETCCETPISGAN